MDAATGLASLWYGGGVCQFTAPLVRVRGHVANIDVALRRGYALAVQVVDGAGSPIVGGGDVAPASFVPEWNEWCLLDTGASPWSYAFDGTQTRVYPEGTYRLFFDNTQVNEVTHPPIWYPSALTANTGRDVVLDRDLTGPAALRMTVPKGYRISGRLVPPEEDFWVQVVTMDGGKVGVVAEGYPNDFNTYTYSFMVPPGTYRVRRAADAVAFRDAYWYYSGGVTSFDQATPVVVTNADVSGIDIIK